VFAAAGMAWLTGLGVHYGYPDQILPALLLIGFGLGAMSPVSASLATFGVAEHEAGIASAVWKPSEQVGASVGAALVNTIAAGGAAYLATRHGEAARLAATVHGYTTAAAWAAGILALGALVVPILVNVRVSTADAWSPCSGPHTGLRRG
jgi:hypothetical protein